MDASAVVKYLVNLASKALCPADTRKAPPMVWTTVMMLVYVLHIKFGIALAKRTYR